jgi:hypothetical protein
MTAYERLNKEVKAMHEATGQTFEIMEQRIAKLEADVKTLMESNNDAK